MWIAVTVGDEIEYVNMALVVRMIPVEGKGTILVFQNEIQRLIVEETVHELFQMIASSVDD